MGETDRSCQELRQPLQESLENLMQWLKQEKYPPADICRSSRLLLMEYVEALSWHVPGFAEEYEIRVMVSDGHGEKATEEEVCNTIKLRPEMLSVLYQLGIRKLLNGKDPRVLFPEWQVLLEQGYIAPVSLESPKGRQEYYTLSSKGWSCFNRKSFQKNLRKQAGENFQSVPEKLLLEAEDWNSLNIIRAAMLEDFYRDCNKEYLSFLYPNGQGLLLGTEISGDDGIRYVCPGIFDGEPTEDQLGLMRELIDSDDVDDVTFLILSDENQKKLPLILDRQETEKVHFYIMEAPDGRKN